MRFRILGPLEVQDGSRTVSLPQGRQRVLLAVLLLHANETLTSDRLIDGLWGEAPPSSAGSSLHNLISGLRKALGDGRLVTRDGGYALQVGDGELDAERFDALVREGRAALAGGEPERAAGRLREALELWHGPALGDLAYHQALAGEAEQLEEARLAALEERIDADLAAGRHADVVAELEGLVVRHPLRERMRAQQMVALYRSGRQADALAAYRDARERLIDELGVEPGPALRRIERAVLEQDPELGAPDALPSAPPPIAWARRHAVPLLVAGALVLAAALGALLIGGGDDPAGRAASVGGARDFLATIDPATGRIVQRLPVGETPTSVAVGAGAAWTINADGQSVSRVDLSTRKIRTYSTGEIPLDIAAGEDAAWLVSSGQQGRAGSDALPPAETLSQLEPGSGTPVANLTLPPSSGAALRGPPQLVAAADGAVWAIGRTGWLQRLDLRSRRSSSFRSLAAFGVASGDGQVWALVEPPPGRSAPNLLRLDPRSGAVLERVAVPSRSAGQLAVGAGAVWVTDPFAGGVWRVDAGPGAPPPRIIAVDQGVEGVAAGADAVWTSNPQTGTVARIDPATGAVVSRIGVGGAPRGIALGAGRLWVTVVGSGTSSLAGSLDPATVVAPVDSRNCGPVLAGPGGDPDLLIVSDVPLAGSWRPAAEAMNAAVAFVLRERGFRAGRVTLAMQACNHALAQTGGPDPLKCQANATAYARNPAVIGVVGPVHSFCSAGMLPLLNRAPGGPVAIVSTANSFPVLVRPDPVALRELYPSGQRGYARVFPSDDYEAAAAALFAQQLAPRGVFYAQDDSDPIWKQWFSRAARRIGLPVVGAATVRVRSGARAGTTRARMLAERIRASGARVVVLSGLWDAIPTLRARLSDDVGLVVAGKYEPVAALFAAAGPAARGAYFTVAGLPRERLGPTGRRFVSEFGATRPGGQVPTLALYAATATEVMLDAIARSDGTRESVSRALAGVRLQDGPLGPIALDGNGEPDRHPIAVVRADHGGEPHDPGGTQGGTVVDVIEPEARLVGEPGSE